MGGLFNMANSVLKKIKDIMPLKTSRISIEDILKWGTKSLATQGFTVCRSLEV